MQRLQINMQVHEPTGLLVATSPDLFGFVVHAHSIDEMKAKINEALVSFIKFAQKKSVTVVKIEGSFTQGWLPSTATAELRAA